MNELLRLRWTAAVNRRRAVDDERRKTDSYQEEHPESADLRQDGCAHDPDDLQNLVGTSLSKEKIRSVSAEM